MTMFEQGTKKLILASQSKARATLLKQTGLNFEIHPSSIDEDIIKQLFRSGDFDGDAADVADILAETKALDVAKKFNSELVIGADQILVLEDKIYDKPSSKDELQSNLLAMRGKTHTLISSLAIAKNEEIVWRHTQEANLTMRDFSPEFLGQYIAESGDEIMHSVGGYLLEKLGVHLFEKIEGDYFTILGFPLLELLSFLREYGWIKS